MPELPYTSYEGNQTWLYRTDGPIEVRPSILATQYSWYSWRGESGWRRRGVWFSYWIGDQITYRCRRGAYDAVEQFTIGGARA